MKLAFMTLGCPKWDLDTIIARGKEYGFDGVDFRGIQDDLDITTLPAFTSGLSETKRKLDDAGLAVSAISSSIKLCDIDNRIPNVDEAKRTIAVAKGLGAKQVRVFGMGDLKLGREKLAEIGLECLRDILALEGARDINWVFETHDHWIQSEHCRLFLDAIPDPCCGALWDMGHTSRVGGETPSQSYEALQGRIYYTHVKDAVHEPEHPDAMKDGWRYVPPGEGQLPLKEAIALLKQNGYDGWLLFEHEKRWHPTLPEPEDIFPKFVKWARPLI